MSSPQLLSTPLFPAHQTAGAVFIDFAGWSMPLRYGSQTAEHLAVRERAGLFDVSHMLAVDIRGADARRLARRVLSNDINRVIRPGGAVYGCMLNPQGGVVDDAIWWVFNERHQLVVLNAACRESDLAWLGQQAEGMRVSITPRARHGLLALQGPHACDLLASALPRYALNELAPMQARMEGEAVISRSGYTGEDGVELILPEDQLTHAWRTLLAAQAVPCGLGARDSLRLEAGMMLYGNELTPQISPLEAGIGWCVDISDPERNFIGRSALEAQRASGKQRRLVGLVLKKGVLRAGCTVHAPSGEQVGIVTSGGYSPFLKASIALALLNAQADTGGELAVTIRSGMHSVQVVSPPFVRKGKILV